MAWTPSSIVTKGVEAAFAEPMSGTPSIWQKHCMNLPATAETMPYAFLGMVPQPREFIGGRNFVNVLDFTYNITNKTYELSWEIPRKWFEDDQVAAIPQRIAEVTGVWAEFKNYQFAQLLINGDQSGYTGWDGTTFYADTRAIGSSANIDNNATSAAATGTQPTAAEFISAYNANRATMGAFQDDTGQRPFAWQHMTEMRVIIPPVYADPVRTAANAQVIAQTSNVWQGAFQIDECPYLTDGAVYYQNAVGGAGRKPFVYSERTALEVVVNQNTEDVALTDMIRVLTRQRYVFTYGDPRLSIQHTFS